MLFKVFPKNRYIEVEAEGKEGVITFPTYTPGSYIIRELERNVVEIEGERISKNKFIVKEKFKYLVYAASRDPREAISTNDYLFINPTAVFPFQDIYEKYCISLRVSNWIINTTLKMEGDMFCGNDYLEFSDSPIEASPILKRIKINNSIYVSTIHDIDKEAVNKITMSAESIMGKVEDDYFFFRRDDKSYGGIEHRNSSSIVIPWNQKDYYLLLAHEYFHRWNIKSIMPKDLNIDFEKESYTEYLWFVEGFTEYMAMIITVKANLFTHDLIGKKIANSLSKLTFLGSKRSSLAEASKTAWIKYYRQDENFLNSSVSYYDGGYALALYSDLVSVRNNKRVYEVFNGLLEKRFYDFNDLEKEFRKIGVENLHDLVYKPANNIINYLEDFLNIELIDKGRPYYGLIVDNGKIVFVEDSSPADKSGLMPNDQIIAVNGINKKMEFEGRAMLLISRGGEIKEIEVREGVNPGHKVKVEGGEIVKKLFNGNIIGISDIDLI